MKTRTLKQEITELFSLRAKIAEAERAVGELKKQKEEIEQRIISMMEQEDITETGVQGIGKVFAKPKIFFSYLKENEEKIIEYFKRDPQLAPFVRETIHHQTFQKAIEGIFEKENKLPPYVESFAKVVLHARSAGEKGGDY